MIRALSTAASGMFAQQLHIDNIANNLANVNTTGFKKSRTEFQDLIYQNLREAGVPNSQGNVLPTELQVGHGVRPVATQKMMTQGDLLQTGNSLDMAIEGNGFFQIRRLDGSLGYTRDGSFKVSSEGVVVTADGLTLEPSITIPENTQSVQITRDGIFSALIAGESEPVEVGAVEMASFINSAGLRSIGQNLYVETSASGPATVSTPGLDNLGTLAQGFLEGANVQVVEEMVDMITAQRAYEVNSRAIRAADEMLQTATSIKR
jgi:flagellar basal-body rod protein FlgG